MATVLRMENEGGLGIYNSPAGSNMFPVRPWDRERQPDPYDDLSPTWWLEPKGRFGFPSLEALCIWFADHEREQLENIHARHGFAISVYEAEKIVAKSERQCVFVPGRRKARVPLDATRAELAHVWNANLA